MTEANKAVFLSYASQDAEAASCISEALRLGGVEVWFDLKELRGGDTWDRQIKRQIHDCALFLPIISNSTQQRREGYFRREWRLAADRTHDMSERALFLVPVVIDNTSDQDADVPDCFLAVQWTRLQGGSTPPAFVERVLSLLSPDQPSASVRASASTDRSAGAAPLHVEPIGRFQSRRPRKPAMLVIAAALVIGGGTFALDKLWLSRRVAPNGVARLLPQGQKTIAEKSIAVLPFVDMSEKKDQEYFSDGLSEELIDQLAHSADLKVIARTSSFQFKGKNEDVRSIAEQLGVANLLEGSVRTAAHEVRITAQLIKASDGTHLWSQTYDRQLSDIFKVQDEIAGMVVQALNAALITRPAGAENSPSNMDAYNFLLKGNYFYDRQTQGDYDRAIEAYQHALALDPNYSLAWAKLARVYVLQGQSGDMTSTAAKAKARDALQRALALDPNSAAAHRWLGRIYVQFEWDFAAAKKEFEQAIALDPTGPEGESARDDLLVWTAFRTGQFDAVIQLAQRDITSNPLDTNALQFLGLVQYFAGHPEDAAAAQRRTLELAPTIGEVQSDLAWSLLFLGNRTEALDAAGKEVDEKLRLASLAAAYWALDRKADSDIALRQLESRFSDVGSYDIAEVHAYRGESDAALRWLEKAYEHRDPLMQDLKVEPVFRDLHSTPVFEGLLRKVKLAD